MVGNQIYILQGALWCKGIGPGSWTGIFNDDTAETIMNFKADAGISSDTASVDSTIMDALLDMSAFVLVPGGNSRIRTIQQNLNHDYLAYTGLQPCDGLYGRQTNTALIYALQAEEGLSPSVANGAFGPSTTSKCPTLQPGDSRKAFVRILQYALCVNDFYNGAFDGIYSESVKSAVKSFQSFMVLPETGIANMTTIKGLLSSAGDTNRDALACDTATRLTASTAQVLKRAGFSYVGRYLTGTVGGSTSKSINETRVELYF
ncbi:putative peptidoglycan binding domain protein [Sporolactobacillus inulinus]|uniref:Putative peptidoglycan binding domain protein n=1 Tax=Sporolactobacillus inulinus TaxID=2078 RepID=A0A4Y1Z7A5_9BACL|nr:peptidoglycan-binding protein [Sporolactobacillus inulinus]GAY74905.1 putative peptidoglycan binding domain protein [Sporolactobacillus inulinus]